ncbi:hypothetical protein [Phyllobacterium sp. K27]
MDMVAPKRIIQTLDRREPDEKNAARTLPKVWQALLCVMQKWLHCEPASYLSLKMVGRPIKNRNFYRFMHFEDKLRAKMPHGITFAFLAM